MGHKQLVAARICPVWGREYTNDCRDGRKDKVETGALFELIALRYERHSIAPISLFPHGLIYRKRSAVARISAMEGASDTPDCAF
ncbi:hypothetical protein C7I87_06895 [Mesorhizobium sp. SARCC-RB16n]|nr:hypothetical protein C7I87_06895 [Mesorhizobium sp. SARCC-RB16n]